MSFRTSVSLLLAITAPAVAQKAISQTPGHIMPNNYRGPETRIHGVFVTPVPNAPFTAQVEIVSHDKLPDGSEHIVKTENTIARSSSGRIHNERRMLVPQEFKGTPRLLSVRIYDPNTNISIDTEPLLHIARQYTLPRRPSPPPTQLAPGKQHNAPDVVLADLGKQTLDDIELVGIRKSRTIPADASGTGRAITITDDYWYSPELSVYLIIRHNDPRTGEQIVAVTHIQRGEPEASLLQIPSDYKLVDETPPILNREESQ